MIGEEHIEAAVTRGIITRAQAGQLRALAAAAGSVPPPSPSDADDERLRLIGGFNDVFVSIGILLLVAALFGMTSTFGFGLGFAGVALVAAWLLSEVFVTRLRLALPAIALALMFAAAGGIAAYVVAGTLLQASGVAFAEGQQPMQLLVGLGAAVAAAMHRRRFHVPIDSALIAAGIVCAVMGGLHFVAPQWVQDYGALLWAIFGLLIFALAVRTDATDPARTTRRADVAFWLHLLAAPMIVYAASSQFVGPSGELGIAQAIGILLLFAGFALVALVLDRRALLVSALSYAGVALGYLLSARLTKDVSLSLTLLALAALVLTLAGRWRSLRAAVLALLPPGRLKVLVPPAS